MSTWFDSILIITSFSVGIVWLSMAWKLLRTEKYLPFYEKAAGIPWEKLNRPLQRVILFLLRICGLWFGIVAGILLTFPAYGCIARDRFALYSASIIAIVFCAWLFLFNYRLYKDTGTDTPWQSSLILLVILCTSLMVSVIAVWIR